MQQLRWAKYRMRNVWTQRPEVRAKALKFENESASSKRSADAKRSALKRNKPVTLPSIKGMD